MITTEAVVVAAAVEVVAAAAEVEAVTTATGKPNITTVHFSIFIL